MRKLLIIPFIILMLLSGCSKQPQPSPPQTEISAKVTCDEEVYNINHNGKSITTISYIEPQELKGLTYSYSGSEVSINYNTLTYKPSGELQDNNITKLHRIIQELSSGCEYLTKSCDSDKTVYELPTALIECSTISGVIQKITLKTNGVVYIFSNLET